MRVLMITQKIDPTDSMLGFVVGWVEQIAARVDHLHILCLEQHPAVLPSNVTVWSMGKEHGRSRVRELLRFYQTLFKVIPQVDVIFPHMVPRYAILAAPLALLFRKPQVLWYVHRHVNLELKLGLAVSKYVATAVPESFPIPSPKVCTLGHGVDSNLFKPDTAAIPDASPLITQVGRLVPIKHQETLLRALAALDNINAKVAFVGEAPHDGYSYVDGLKTFANELKIADRVEFTGRKTLDGVHEMYLRSTVSINLSPSGLFDKAALESMMTNVPTIVSTSAFDSLLGEYAEQLRITGPDDITGLTHKLRALLALSSDERCKMGAAIGERARAKHSLTGLMDRLVTLMNHAAFSEPAENR